MAAFYPIAADALVKATLLLAAVAAGTFLLRRRSAALRHLLWTLGICGAVIVPAVVTLVPFRWRVLPPVTAGLSIVASRELNADAAPSVPASAAMPRRADAVLEAADRSIPTRSPAVNAAPPGGAIDPATMLLAIWLAGVALLLARFGLGLRAVRTLVRRATVVTDEQWLDFANRAARALGVATRVELRRSVDSVMPFACGIARPVIVLPASADEWTWERRNAVLMHEYAHISRGDLAMNMLSHVVRALYWFHPLAWLAAYRLRVEGERACDDAVLRSGARPSDYAEHLLGIVRAVGQSVPTVALAMARRSDFEGRLLAILEPGISRLAMPRWRATAMAAVFIVTVMPLSAMAPITPPTVSETLTVAPEPASQDPAPPRPQEPVTPTTPERTASAQSPATAVTALIETLGDANASVRRAAANSLGQLGDPRAIAALAKALREDADPRVREAAAHALGQIDDTRAVPHLLAALRTERAANVRERIVAALREIDDPAAVAGIIAVLKDPSVAVRREAVSALGELEDAAAVPALLEMVRDEDAEVRMQTAEALGSLESTAALGALSQMTKDADKEVRVRAVSALGELQDQRALAALVAALKDSNAEVRYHAADAIGDIDGLRVAPPALLEALQDTDSEVRQNAANSLGEIGDEAAVPPLRRLTGDSDVEVRRAAAEALSEIGGAAAIQTLMTMLKDPDPEIRRIVAEALGSRDR